MSFFFFVQGAKLSLMFKQRGSYILMHPFLAGTGSPASPIQLHSCCRCTRGRDWKCTFSFPCAIFLCTFCIILYEYQSSDIDASVIQFLAGSCEILNYVALLCIAGMC